MKEANRWSVNDIITTALLSAVLIVQMMFASMPESLRQIYGL